MATSANQIKVQQSPDFYKIYKNLDIRIRKQFDKKLRLFIKNPLDSHLRNHKLRGEWEGYRSIDITADYRAIYEEITEEYKLVAYFIALGTHKQLYGK